VLYPAVDARRVAAAGRDRDRRGARPSGRSRGGEPRVRLPTGDRGQAPRHALRDPRQRAPERRDRPLGAERAAHAADALHHGRAAAARSGARRHPDPAPLRRVCRRLRQRHGARRDPPRPARRGEPRAAPTGRRLPGRPQRGQRARRTRRRRAGRRRPAGTRQRRQAPYRLAGAPALRAPRVDRPALSHRARGSRRRRGRRRRRDGGRRGHERGRRPMGGGPRRQARGAGDRLLRLRRHAYHAGRAAAPSAARLGRRTGRARRVRVGHGRLRLREPAGPAARRYGRAPRELPPPEAFGEPDPPAAVRL